MIRFFTKCLALVLVTGLTISDLNAAALTEAQKDYIDTYVKENGLNTYGDPEGTVYTGGTPLFSEITGETLDRYDYILRNNPEILDGFVSVLPTEGLIAASASASAFFGNDFDARRVDDRAMQAILTVEAEREALCDALYEAVRDARYEVVSGLLDRIERMDSGSRRELRLVLKKAKRVLQFEAIQPIEQSSVKLALVSRIDTILSGLMS